MALSRRYPKWLIWVLEIVLVLGIYLAVRTWHQRDLAHGAAPSISTYTLDGTPLSLQDSRGRPLLLHFWATWCPICRLEQGALDALAKDWRVITVAHRSGNDTEIRSYMRENNLDFPVILDEQGAIGAVFGVSGVPTSFIIDSQGRIRFSEVGFTTKLGLQVRLWWAQHFDP